MRIARLVPLVAILAFPLAAQGQALEARLVYSGFGTPSFEISKPAYVALFEVTASGVMQLYPSRTSQLHQLLGEGRTFFSPQDMAFVERMNQGFMFDPFSQVMFASNYSTYTMYAPVRRGSIPNYTFGRRGLFLVASTEPLDVGAPVTTQIRLNRTLASQGHYFDLNVEPGLDALTALVTASSASSEIATDFVPILEQYGSLADGLYEGYGTYLTHCRRFGAIPVVDAWRFGALCPSGVIVQVVTPEPVVPAPQPTPEAPGTVADGGCRQYGKKIGPCRGSSGGTPVTAGEGSRITDPERIRQFLAEMIDRTPAPGVGGSAPAGDGSVGQPRGREVQGREAPVPSIGGMPRTLDDPHSWARGSATGPTASSPRAAAPRSDQPRAETPGARMAPHDRSSAPHASTNPSPMASPPAPAVHGAPASSPSASTPAPPPKP